MVFWKFRRASLRCSAGELTLGELDSELWESEDKPRVKRVGRVAIVVWEERSSWLM